MEDAETRETPIDEPEPAAFEEGADAKSDAFRESPSVGSASIMVQEPAEPKPISSRSLGGSYTDNISVQGTGAPSHRTTGGHQPKVNQLSAETVLNSRYEIVRRIGGGGMGAVYLAKDRNLGDASRGVKEMVEAHLDPTCSTKKRSATSNASRCC